MSVQQPNANMLVYISSTLDSAAKEIIKERWAGSVVELPPEAAELKGQTIRHFNCAAGCWID